MAAPMVWAVEWIMLSSSKGEVFFVELVAHFEFLYVRLWLAVQAFN
jgi:hypothetical protein